MQKSGDPVNKDRKAFAKQGCDYGAGGGHFIGVIVGVGDSGGVVCGVAVTASVGSTKGAAVDFGGGNNGGVDASGLWIVSIGTIFGGVLEAVLARCW